MATIPTPEQGKPILDFPAGTFDGSSYLFQSRNGATEHINGDDVADYVNTSRIYNGLDTTAKTPVGAINEINAKDASDISYDNTASGLTATNVQAAIDEVNGKDLGDIDDVNLSSPANGDVLAFDSTSSKWVNNNLNDFIVTERIQTNSVTIEANANGSARATCVKNGYRALGIVGFQSFSTSLAIAEFSCGTNTAVVYLKNMGSAQISGSCTITILFVKNFEGE